MAMPKSALRHRPIHEDAIAPQAGVPPRARAAQPWRTDGQVGISFPLRTATGRGDWIGDQPAGNGNVREDRTWSTRSGTKYADVAVVEEDETHSLDEDEEEESPFLAKNLPSVRQRASAVAPERSAALPAPRTRAQVTTTHTPPARRVHSLLPVGVGMMVMLLIYLGISWVCVWVVGLHDDWTYGTMRTFHLDAVVGHTDSLAHPTHLLAINSRGQVVIIEFPGGDLAHAKIYPGPHLPWSDAATSVITLSLRDVTRDGKPDLVISIRQEPTLLSSWWNPPLTTLVMINTGSGFKPAIQPSQP